MAKLSQLSPRRFQLFATSKGSVFQLRFDIRNSWAELVKRVSDWHEAGAIDEFDAIALATEAYNELEESRLGGKK